ncbi:MAG: hypothetical protein M1549_00745 [Candidatus Dependentiae bacterium]|nr:hypothetical protein [Candidatus Dependentiae bacterium]
MNIVRSLHLQSISLFSLILLLPVGLCGMKITKNVVVLMNKLAIPPSQKKQTAKTPLTRMLDKYYESNQTVLVSNESLTNTINKVQKILFGEAVNNNIDKLAHAAQNGAKILYAVVQGNLELAANLAKTISHADVCDIMRYLYLQSCNIRPDETGFKEGIIILPPGDSYTEKLRTLLSLYWLQRKSDGKFILSAKTQDAFRLMCTEMVDKDDDAPSPEDKNEKIEKEEQGPIQKFVRFLDRFDNFHITVPIDAKKGIRIKLERHPKIGIINKIKTRAGRTPNFGPEYSKETDVPQNLVEKFLKTFPQESGSAQVSNLSSMYNQILTELKKSIDDERRYELFSCLTNFEKYACEKNLSHLTIRTGSEIILGEERLFEAAFSEKGTGAHGKTAQGILLVFKKLRETIRAYATAETSNDPSEEEVCNQIARFRSLIDERKDAITDKNILSYYQTTALTLQYTATITGGDPKSPAATLKGRLRRPLFEKTYQKTLSTELAAFVKNAADKNGVGQTAPNLAEKTDETLFNTINEFSNKYVGTGKDLPKQLAESPNQNQKIGDLIETDNKVGSLLQKPLRQLVSLRTNLDDFPRAHHELSRFLSHLIGTAKDIYKSAGDGDKDQKFCDTLNRLKTDVMNLFEEIGKGAEKNGYVCSSSRHGKKIIKAVEPANLLQKNIKVTGIGRMKKIPRLFPSEQELTEHVQKLYNKAN